MTKLGSPLLLLAILIAFAVPHLVLAQDEGIISGQVIAADSSDVSGLEVTLSKYQGQAGPVSSTTTTDSQGRYQFSNLSTTSDCAYLTSVTYKEVLYHGDLVSFNAGEQQKDNVNLNVYDTTTNDPGIKAAFSHTIITIENGSLLIKENLIFSNPSNQTYIGSDSLSDGIKSTLRFWLPAEAYDVQPGTGFLAMPSPTQDGFVDSTPVLPDNHQTGFSRQMAFSYRLKCEGTCTLSHTIYYPTTTYSLLVQSGGTEVEAAQMTSLGNTEIGGIKFLQLGGQDLSANVPVSISISLSSDSEGLGYLKWLALGLGLVLTGLVLGLFFLRQRLSPVRVKADRNNLLRQLADLDDEFEAGHISEEEYRETRSRIKAELMKR